MLRGVSTQTCLRFVQKRLSGSNMRHVTAGMAIGDLAEALRGGR